MRSIVRDIYIKLPRYRFFDSPYPKSHGEDPKYMTRAKVESQLRARLTNSNRSGSILVSGYRGVGKTSMVRKVLRDLKRAHRLETEVKASTWLGRHAKAFLRRLRPRKRIENPFFVEVEVNLAQDELDVRTILRVMATELLRTLIKLDYRPVSGRYVRLKTIRIIFGIVVMSAAWFTLPSLIQAQPLIHPIREGFTPDFGDSVSDWLNLAVRLAGPLLIGALAFRLLKSFQRVRSPFYMEHSLDHVCVRLQHLIDRIGSTIDEESQAGITPSSALPFSGFLRKRKSYPIASTKEIELELIDILDRFGRLDNDPFVRGRIDHAQAHLRNKRYIVFVVDELDKLVPRGFKSIWDKEREDPTDDAVPGAMQPGIGPKGSDLYRERQEAVATLFANLKHFLNVAQAKFIFIGGHDLYEGILADTSDRDPFFGSIFNQVIYVPTLLKEEQMHCGGAIRGLATTVERFVAESMLSQAALEHAHRHNQLATLQHVHGNFRANSHITDEEALQINQALQHFCIYLTFRSNGSTKKLVQLFERCVHNLTAQDLAQLTAAGSAAGDCIQSTLAASTTGSCEPGLYLRLSPIGQHAHGLLTHIYRPFLTDMSRLLSQLNDKNLVSFTYLLDHLFKYHSTAFSFFHLHLTPETIAVDKIPDYHKFMDDTIQRLGMSSIRQVDNGLFGFQFYTKLYNEIAVLSKISDLDSAALNFSLDESLPVKQHFYRRLHQAQQNDRGRDKGGPGHSPMALSSIHHTLGDLHYYDQQLDDALAQYRSATHLLEHELRGCLRPAVGPAARPRRDHFNQYVKIKLKEILCLEKMKIVEVALAVSSQLTQDILAYVRQWRAMDIQDIGNWRLLTLALVHRIALLDKTARKGILPTDLEPLQEYMAEISLAHRRPLHEPVRLEAALHEHLGTVLHYSGIGIPQDTRLPLNGSSARDAYARALSIALWAKRKRTVIALNIWTSLVIMPEKDKPRLQLIAGCLSKYTDALIATGAFGAMVTRRGMSPLMFGQTDVTAIVQHPDIGDIAAHILMTARAYLMCDSQFQAIFQIKKLLHLLLERTRRSSLVPIPWEAIDSLCDWAVSTVHAYNGRIDAMQLAKARTNLKAHQYQTDWALSRLISYSADIREIEVLRNELYLKAGLISGAEIITRYGHDLSESTSTYARMRILMLCIRTNWDLLDRSIKDQIAALGKTGVSARTTIDFAGTDQAQHTQVVRDALASCIMLIDAAHLYGTGFVANNTVLGKIHSHMADWCMIMHGMKLIHQTAIQEQLRLVLGDRYAMLTDPLRLYTKALNHFRRAQSMHGRGKQYRRVMNDMFLLEDDYKDNFYHFCFALERMVVLDNGQAGMKKRIDKLRAIVKNLGESRSGHMNPPMGPAHRRRPHAMAIRYA